MLKQMTCPVASISAGPRLGAGTVFEVKCLFAIDAIAVVYRADSARFESEPTRKPIRNSDQQSADLTNWLPYDWQGSG